VRVPATKSAKLSIREIATRHHKTINITSLGVEAVMRDGAVKIYSNEISTEEYWELHSQALQQA